MYIFSLLFWQDLKELKEQFEKLKSNNKNQRFNDEANERLKNITMETEKLAKEVEDKMKQIEGTISEIHIGHTVQPKI